MARFTGSPMNFTIGSSSNTPNSDCCTHYSGKAVEVSVPYMVNAVFNVLLAIATTFANILVFLAMRRSSSIRLPSKLLLCSLVLTDLGTGLVVQPQFIVLNFMFSYRLNSQLLMKSFNFAASLFISISLTMMTAISLDRYSALFFHLRYHEIVTTRRVFAVLTFFCSFSLAFASTSLWDVALSEVIMTIGTSICFLIISVAYIKIFRHLRFHHSPQIQPQGHKEAQQGGGSTSLNMARYRKTACAMMWIYVLFVTCIVPFQCVILILHFEPTVITSHDYLSFTFVLLNSCLNPFVYCLRLPEIRAEVLKQLRKISCQSHQQ